MDEGSIRYTSYTSRHSDVIEQGAESIHAFLLEESTQEKLNILLCMDKYLDPWFGYDPPHFDATIIILEQHLFLQENDEVKEDIINLLCMYSLDTLDYLADHIDELDSPHLAEAVYALGMTSNPKYIPIVSRYTLYDHPAVQQSATEALQLLHQAKDGSNPK